MELQKIEFLKNITNFVDVKGGYSGAIKKYFKKDGKEYFLKIGSFKVEPDIESLLQAAKIPHPRVIESGVFDKNNDYIIEEFFDGIPLKEKFNENKPKFIYEFGFKIGTKYRDLRDIYPDKPVDKKTYVGLVKKAKITIRTLKNNVKKFKKEFTKEQKSFIHLACNFLTKHYKLIKNSVLVFGHTDIKPSNFLINGSKIIAIDIQQTKYKELSQSMIWSYARSDFNDEKNFAFAQGYLDGLFNFDIPQGFLKCCNFSYVLNICKIINKNFDKNKIDKIYQIIKHVQENYIIGKEFLLDKHLDRFSLIKNIPLLKGFKINLVPGSYSPHNLTFKCTKEKQKYFLKIMEISKSINITQCLKNYKTLENLKIPTSPLRYFGELEENKTFYAIFDFINYNEMGKGFNPSSIQEGEKLGIIVAKELKKLKSCQSKEFKIFDKNVLFENLKKDIETIFEDKENNSLLYFSKQELLLFINKLVKSFNREKISLIHGDIKFGNILYNGKNLIFVDNESLMLSYDIINFYHNILSKFDGKDAPIQQGFLRGYIKYMNNGKIPARIDGQIKLLLLARLLKDAKEIIKKSHSNKKIHLLNDLCEKYIKKDEEIKWLK